MSLITSYSNTNKVIQNGKTQRITCTKACDPVLTVQINMRTSDINFQTSTWYECICHSTASYSYVGMTYAAARTCADAMRTKFTRSKQVWSFTESFNQQTQVYTMGWTADKQAIVQEAEINLVHDGGHMYHVDVIVDCEDVKMSTNPSTVTFSYPSCMSDVD